MKISVIVPFYKGNNYLSRLFESIEKTAQHTNAIFEVIIVNDSPWECVILPDSNLNTSVVANTVNIGIHGSRINGIKHATGEWILMLDQDDELVPDGFIKQIELTRDSDVVVGNGLYILGNIKKNIYQNLKTMKYLIQKERFIEIRNLIPSPGECLIKKSVIPNEWMNVKLENNGSDDWMLWLSLFTSNAKFACNELNVYIHNDAHGNNLSANLDKMRKSSLEMVNILKKENVLTEKEITKLKDSINFKYYQDTKKLSFFKVIKYRSTIVDNIIYKMKVTV